jgi:histidinol dehydrogenase
MTEKCTTQRFLREVAPDEAMRDRHDPIDDATLEAAKAIMDDVRVRGETAVREHAERLGDLHPGQPLILEREELDTALQSISHDDRAVLERTAARITQFADAQRKSLHDLSTTVQGGRAGHRFVPVDRAGCYAPGGRYPLPSSVLMTVIAARAAGVGEVIAASPRPGPIMQAAASIAGADRLLTVGGAHAIAALADGCGDIAPCDAIVGPGNRWVTAAKKLIAGRIAIDMLAGPSELLIIADAHADAAFIAADLLAQAEHDDDALPTLITTDRALLARVEVELAAQLADLPTAQTARNALRSGMAIIAATLDEAASIANAIAPEHLQLHLNNPREIIPILRHYGGLFIGAPTAEVFGDYGIGPNHTLPTSGAAKHAAGLSVMTFLRAQTWIELDQCPAEAARDAISLARIEGLEAHARAVERRAKAGP